jgi:hypothetical protein
MQLQQEGNNKHIRHNGQLGLCPPPPPPFQEDP